MTPADPARARDIKAIHAMKRELALEDDGYKAILSRVTAGRVASSADMTPSERRALLDELRRLGGGKKTGAKARAEKRSGGGPLTHPSPQGGEGSKRPIKPANTNQQKMMRGLWLELAALGEIKDASEAALAAYVLRQAKVDALQFVSSDKAQAVIGGLRGWLKRAKKQRGIA